MRMPFFVLIGFCFTAVPAHAQLVTCQGVDDTKTIQAAINKYNHVILPAGICAVSSLNGTKKSGIKSGLVIEGQGLMLSEIIPIKSNANVIDLTGSSNVTLSKFRICGYCTSVIPTIGILSAQMANSSASDVFACDRVRVDGSFSLAALYVLSVASSNIEYCQFYNYQPNAITAIFTGNNFFGAASAFVQIDNANDQIPSDWTITGSEFHDFGGQVALWLGAIIGVRFYGGNVSWGSKTNGSSVVSVDDETINGSNSLPADIIFDGTTFYTDSGAKLNCDVSVSDPSVSVNFRANYSPNTSNLTGC